MMAESNATGDIGKVKLQQRISVKGMELYYVPRKLLSIGEISAKLKDKTTWTVSGRRMFETLGQVRPHHFQHMQVSFPITHLQHVTGRRSMDGIYSLGGFIAKQHDRRPELNDLSFWSVDVSSHDMEAAREEAYEAVRRVVTPADGENYRREIKEQFANSPAFLKTSRYGNFRFSFPLSDLLAQYKSQFCGGEEPQLRILGTDLYRQEIAHYIVVHGPDADQYMDLPVVLSVTSGSGPLPFVYWMDGTLHWRPESTSLALKVKISEDVFVTRECYKLCDWYTTRGDCVHDTYSVWNHLVFAFHIPKGQHLKIPKQDLRKNLSVCGKGDPFLGTETTLSAIEAQDIINSLDKS
ncbi:uncharacterized protein LOC135028622 [Pseudophryne corroboree]|uniref:uncharacterized protein LOC135028622 n=1 Tax=Pseudophryne corroboree TaxID=495146 RepID=UPI003081AE39